MTRRPRSPKSARSYLYVPGDRPGLFAKAAASGADAVILDLEDAVLPAAKATALAAVEEHLRENPGSTEWWVRIDSAIAEEHILRLSPLAGMTGIMVPKATAASVEAASRTLAGLEIQHGLQPGRIQVIALIESARGVLELSEIAGNSRVLRFGLGEADLIGELGIQPSVDRSELWPIRLQVIVASAAAGLSAPIGPVHLSLQDTDELQGTTAELRRLGFRARTALHPRQIPHINQGFMPTAEEIQKARSIMKLFTESVNQGTGVLTDGEGRFIDEAVVRAARAVIELGDDVNSSR